MNEKLIRDKVPGIMRDQGLPVTVRQVQGEEYARLLLAKLHEEISELLTEPTVSEFADIMEVLRALARVAGLRWADVASERIHKSDARGGLYEGWVWTYGICDAATPTADAGFRDNDPD